DHSAERSPRHFPADDRLALPPGPEVAPSFRYAGVAVSLWFVRALRRGDGWPLAVGRARSSSLGRVLHEISAIRFRRLGRMVRFARAAIASSPPIAALFGDFVSAT